MSNLDDSLHDKLEKAGNFCSNQNKSLLKKFPSVTKIMRHHEVIWILRCNKDKAYASATLPNETMVPVCTFPNNSLCECASPKNGSSSSSKPALCEYEKSKMEHTLV